MKKAIALLALALFLIPVAKAEQTTRTITYYGGFVDVAEAGTVYSKTFKFKAPDGIEKIYYIKARIVADIPYRDTKVYAGLNNELCTPSHYYIDSPTMRYVMEFDCTSLWKGEGAYKAGFYATKEIKNAYAEWAFTYLNNPYSKLQIIPQGTEYYPNDNATIFVQLLDPNQKPINNATCLASVYYPDKSEWLRNSPMIWLEGSDGLYYLDLIAPERTGVYMVSVKCLYVISETRDYADDFTLSQGVEITGDYTETWKDDNSFHGIKEKVVGGYIFDIYYDFYNLVKPANYTGLIINWIGKWDSSEEEVNFYLYDFCNSSWSEPLPNSISTNTPTVTNFLPKDEWNISCYLNDSTLRLRFHDTNDTEKEIAGTLLTDFLEVKMAYLTYGQVQDVRGSGEIHVKLLNASEIAEAVWDYPERNLTFYNQSELLSMISEINQTINKMLSHQEAVNQSIISKLHSMQEEISNLSSLVNQVNASLHSKLDEAVGYLLEINESANSINSKLAEIQGNLSEISSKLDCINASLQEVESSVTSVNDTLKLVNSSIWSKLYSIQDELEWVSNKLLNISSMILNHNSSVMSKLYSMQDEIASVNETVKAHNATVFSKLHSIQSDLENISKYISNVTNITINATVNITQAVDDLYYRIRNFVVAYFSTEVTNVTCIDNSTLREYRVITYKIVDEKGKVEEFNVTKWQDFHCAWGCSNNECRKPPWIAWGIVFGIVVLFIILYFILR